MPSAPRAVPSNINVIPPSGTVSTATGPVFPFGAKMSPTKRKPELFGWVKSAIVALATLNEIGPANWGGIRRSRDLM